VHYKVYPNVFSKSIIDSIINYYNKNQKKHLTNTMLKIENPWELDIIQNNVKPILSKYFNVNLPNIGDNIYKHTDPYFPHADLSKGYPCFNVLIPLKLSSGSEQKFNIFDQYVSDYTQGATWVGKWYSTDFEFEHNKKREYPYNDSIVEGITDNTIDNTLVVDDREDALFTGLSGVAVDYTPGSLIIFDSKHIHCTGTMHCDWKMGLSLRFKGKFDEEVI